MTNYIGSGKEESSLFEALSKLGKLTEKCSFRASTEIGISDLPAKQAGYLSIIAKNPLLTSSKFADLLGISKPSVTEIVNKLIAKGLVLKQHCNRDKRVFYIALTEKGKKANRVQEIRDQKVAGNLCKNLTPSEIQALTTLIRKAVD